MPIGVGEYQSPSGIPAMPLAPIYTSTAPEAIGSGPVAETAAVAVRKAALSSKVCDIARARDAQPRPSPSVNTDIMARVCLFAKDKGEREQYTGSLCVCCKMITYCAEKAATHLTVEKMGLEQLVVTLSATKSPAATVATFVGSRQSNETSVMVQVRGVLRRLNLFEPATRVKVREHPVARPPVWVADR
jgi:hypothetical protein